MVATTDMTKMFNEMMNAFPVDTTAFQDSFKSYAAFGEKFSKVALEAADRSNEVAAKYTRDTIAKMSDVTRVKDEPADYSKSMTEFASAQAEATAESMAAYAEIAKKVQMETVELMMAAGRDFQDDVQKATKKAGTEAKKATAAAK